MTGTPLQCFILLEVQVIFMAELAEFGLNLCGRAVMCVCHMTALLITKQYKTGKGGNMFCTKCGTPKSETAKFCNKCGATILPKYLFSGAAGLVLVIAGFVALSFFGGAGGGPIH